MIKHLGEKSCGVVIKRGHQRQGRIFQQHSNRYGVCTGRDGVAEDSESEEWSQQVR